MSIFTKNAEQIRKAKYRVKNAQGQYEVVYLETSADQVEQTSDRVFVTPEEKSQITINKDEIAAEKSAREAADNVLSGRLDVVEGEGEGSIKKALQDAKAHTNAEVVKLQNADSALDVRVKANEDALALVDGKIATAKGEAVSEANNFTEVEIGKIDAAFKEADTAIKGRLDSLESNTSDLADIRRNISSNTAAITKEVSDRTAAVKAVDEKLTAEVSRATKAEENLGNRISNVEGEVARVEGLVETKSEETLTSAKSYTDGKVAQINSVNQGLADRVSANETALGTVDSRIATAKEGAVNEAKAHTNSEITKLDTALKAADAQILSQAKAHADSKVVDLDAKLTNTINAVDVKVDGVDGKVDALTERVSTNESDIANLKDAVSNKNNNTIVVNTEAEIATENPTPKVGDLAYVVSSKRAYIYKGVNAIAVRNVPTGWVVFDEITSELDLKDYLKKSEAEATYRKLSVKIVEGDLATELATKINNKLEANQVNSMIENAVNPVNSKVDANTTAISSEVSERKSEITRVEGVLTSAKSELNSSINAVNSKVDTTKSDLTSALNQKEADLKAEDTKLNNRIDKFVPVISGTEPQGTEAGHVWLELV